MGSATPLSRLSMTLSKRRSELFLITAAMVPAIGELDLGDDVDVGMLEDHGILARIEGRAGAAKLQRGDGRLCIRLGRLF
jgi:hypothetical protein